MKKTNIRLSIIIFSLPILLLQGCVGIASMQEMEARCEAVYGREEGVNVTVKKVGATGPFKCLVKEEKGDILGTFHWIPTEQEMKEVIEDVH